jgi:hypothetical protein
MKTYLLLLTLFLSAAGTLLSESVADTPEERRKQAERYLQATPPKALFEDMARKMAASMPSAEQAQFVQNFIAELDIKALTKAMTDAMIKHFTAEEIKALADFYGSPVGKSAMSKFGNYMAELMPVIQSEIMKVQSKATRSKPDR